MKKPPELHKLILVLLMCELKDQKVAEEKGTLAIQMSCFRLCYSLPKRTLSATVTQYGASAAPMTGRIDHDIGGELCTDILTIVSAGLQLYKNTGRSVKREGDSDFRFL